MVSSICRLVRGPALLLAALTLGASSGFAGNLSYHGGRVLHHPRVHMLYWHDNWDGIHTDPLFKRANIDAWVQSFMSGNFWDTAGQYNVHSGSLQTSNGPSILTLVTDPGSTTNSLFIHLWLTAEVEIPGTGVPYPCDDDDVYVVLIPKGTQIDNIFNHTCDSFGAYHLFAPIVIPPFACDLDPLPKGQTAPYVVIPVDCATKAPGPNGFYNDFDGLTALLSHEIVEAATDPLDTFITSIPVIGDIFQFIASITGGGPGWYDDSLPIGDLFTKAEAADKCEFSPFKPDVWLNDSIVSAYWSNTDGTAAAGPGIVTTFGLAQTGVPGGIAVPVSFDNRAPEVGIGGPFSIQVATNTQHSYTFPTPVNGATGVRYVTSEPPATVTVTGPFSKTATYTAQYNLTVSTNPAAAAVGNSTLTPSGFYDAGPFTIHADKDVSAGSGSRFDFSSWSGGISSITPDYSFNLSAPMNAVANYALQRLIDFQQAGIPAAVPWQITVGATPHAGPYSEWFNDGSAVNYSYQTPVPDLAPGTRYVLTGSAPPSGFAANAPTTVIGTYKTQHLLTINTTGLGANLTNLFNNGTHIGTASDVAPYSDWYDHGTPLGLTADLLVNGAGGIEYFFQNLSPVPPATLLAPFATTAKYETMDQLIQDALNSGGISGPGSNGIGNALSQKWAAVTHDLAAPNYNAALGSIKGFIALLQAQSGSKITPALAKTLELDALMVFHSALCKGVASGDINTTKAAMEYAWYSSLVTSLGGVVLPAC
ncbi:MAG TPA: hypothetical protein VGM51_12500 [Armatimonadota bacterium]